MAQKYPGRRVLTVFHPHTFSRTKALISDFAKSFLLSDKLYIIEIYSSAREARDNKISSLDLIEEINKYNQKQNKKQKIKYFKDLAEAEKYLPTTLREGDVLLLLGAGDIFRIAYRWLNIK